MIRKMLFGGLLFTVASMLVACASVTLPQQSQSATAIEITVTEFQFSPQQIVVGAGSGVTLTLTNTGDLNHNLTIMARGYSVQPPFDEADQANVVFQLDAAPGESVSGTFSVPDDAGTYQIVSSLPAYLEGGMVAEIVAE